MQRHSKPLFLGLLLGTVALLTPCFWNWIQPSFSSSCAVTPGTSAASSPTRILTNGTTVIDGTPVFPFGFYHVSWSSTTAEQHQDLQTIADAGFNTIHASVVDPAVYGLFLAKAKRLGIQVITEPSSTEIVTKYGRESAVLGWNIGDDVDNGKQPPEMIAAKNTAIKRIDPGHFTYVSGYSQNLVKNYANTADILAMQSYPINFGREAEISETYPLIAELAQGLRGCNRAAYSNLQSFSWSEAQPEIPGLRAPTPQEARNMTYQALVAGTKGIIYYTFSDGKWILPQRAPALWAGLKGLVPEIKALAPYLLQGNLVSVKTRQPKVFAGWWTLQKKALLIVVNASYQKNSQIVLSLPTPFKNIQLKNIQALFRDRPLQQSQLTPNQVALTLKPLGVVVYQVQL